MRGALAVIVLVTGCTTPPAVPGDAGDVGATMDGQALAPLDGASEAVVADEGAEEPLDATRPPDAAPPLRVLFVGNSFTYVNDLPAVVRALGAATAGAAVEVDSVVRGGAFLTNHLLTTGARDRIAGGGFGAVVLQGQSAETLTDPSSFAVAAGQLAGAARDGGARTVWFATWALRWPALDRVAVVTRDIERAYQDAARANGGVVARVGAAWHLALTEQPGVALHADDGSHPSPAGTLLAACVLLQALTGQTPRVPDPPPLGLSRATASALCALAPRVLCNEGMGLCDGGCVDLASDPNRCGACDAVCPGVEPCQRGRCGCAAGLTPCARTACVNALADTANCGACGTRCPTGGVCQSGRCRCPDAAPYSERDPALRGALGPACLTPGEGAISECTAAVHRYCRALDCFSSGFGPTPVPGFAYSAVCVAGDVRTISYTSLRALVPACDGRAERIGPSCNTAISRYCASTGAVSGFGPVASAGDEVTVTCLPRAVIVRTTFEALRCGPAMAGLGCSQAISFLCNAMGHVSGFGPVETAGSSVDVVCVDP
ncbi:MAG: hypothetical protein HY909_15685 [Deltaproteobacteria bacterium]|nr:hypothetical protein [Deltaproteobacteria bacterium]